jgi:hypothetical protein
MDVDAVIFATGFGDIRESLANILTEKSASHFPTPFFSAHI